MWGRIASGAAIGNRRRPEYHSGLCLPAAITSVFGKSAPWNRSDSPATFESA
jgi:hypothetical protein